MTDFSNHVFINAKQFLKLADFFYDEGLLSEASIAVATNYAFSIELMLKCLETTIIPSASVDGGVLSEAIIKTNIRGHDLKKIFDDLSEDKAKKLANKFKIISGKEIEPLLCKCKDYFEIGRYFHDPESKIVYDISAVRCLAKGIEESIENWYL